MDAKELTLREVMLWIIDNSEDKDAIEKINKLTFTFTDKYKNWTDK